MNKLEKLLILKYMSKELKKIDTERNDRFIQGFACAVASLIKINGEVDTRTRELFRSGIGQLTIGALKKRGVDEYDLETFQEFWTELH